MISFCHHNHIRFGWGDGRYNFDNYEDRFWFSLSRCSRKPLNFQSEVSDVCKKIAQVTRKPIYVCFSGGIDSEIVCIEFLRNKIPFIPLIVRHAHGNYDDIQHAYSWCKAHNITPEMIHCNVESMIDDETLPGDLVYRKFQAYLMRYIHSKGGYPVICSGEQRYEQRFTRHPSPGYSASINYYSATLSPIRWMQENDMSGCPYFFLYTPELMLSFATDDVTEKYFEDQATHFVPDYLSHNLKERVYRRYWPELSPRPKLSGFEPLDHIRTAWEQERVKDRIKVRQYVEFTREKLILALQPENVS